MPKCMLSVFVQAEVGLRMSGGRERHRETGAHQAQLVVRLELEREITVRDHGPEHLLPPAARPRAGEPARCFPR